MDASDAEEVKIETDQKTSHRRSDFWRVSIFTLSASDASMLLLLFFYEGKVMISSKIVRRFARFFGIINIMREKAWF